MSAARGPSSRQQPHLVVVAIDGPAASGKSSTAMRLAKRLGFRHVDSGSLYRAAAAARVQLGGEGGAWTESGVLEAAALVRLEPGELTFVPSISGRIAEEELRSEVVVRHVSVVARMPGVRNWVNEQVRAVARLASVVVDGRDMGSVVFPDAAVKVFLVADARVRARRRVMQRDGHEPTDAELDEETERLNQRDARDAAQTVPAADAVIIDTTGLTEEEQVERLVRLVRLVADARG